MSRKYATIREEDAERTKEWVKKSVRDWHDRLHPDAIFLAECSATPVGYLIKETWRNMYPDETLPKFYRIDGVGIYRELKKSRFVSEDSEEMREDDEGKKIKTELDEFFRKRLPHGKESKVLVYDHGIDHGQTRSATGTVFLSFMGLKKENYAFETGVEDYTLSLKEGSTVRSGATGGKTGGFDTGDPTKMSINEKKIEKLFNRKEAIGKTFDLKDLPNVPRYTLKEVFGEEEHIAPTMKRGGYYIQPIGDGRGYVDAPLGGAHGYADPKLTYNFRGRIIKHPEARKKSLLFIRDLKKLGKEAGIEARQEEQNKKDLEHRVTSIITIGSFLASALFISSNITGNAIANLSIKTASLVGVSLFAIGLVAGFFWLKSRKSNVKFYFK